MFSLQRNPSRVSCTFSSFSITLLNIAGRILLGCLSVSSLPSHLKMSPLMIHLSLVEKNVTWSKMNRWVVPVQWCSSQPGTAVYLRSCELVHWNCEAATICPTITLVSSSTLSEAYTTGSFGRLADKSSGSVESTCCRQYSSHWRTLSTWLTFGFV